MTSQQDLIVLGGFQTDFAIKGLKIDELVKQTVEGTLATTGISASQVEAVYVSNALGELFTNQSHLGAMVSTVVPGLNGVPSMRYEAACASGSGAFLGAMSAVQAGWYDVALIAGAEIMRDKTTVVGDDPMAAADWDVHKGRIQAPEGKTKVPIWAKKFSQIADEYLDRYGLDYEVLRAIAAGNYDKAKSNPNAHTRNWDTPPAFFGDDDTTNPKVAGMFRRPDCSQVSDGGAGLVVVSEDWWRQNRSRVQGPVARISGWGHTTTSIPLQENLAASIDAEYMFPYTRKAITDAFRRAGIKSVWDLDGIELHDCFSITQLVLMDHFGITKPGCIDDGLDVTARDGILPINSSGGLIGAGHPLGASGIRMILDAYKQVTNQAIGYQIPGAKRVATANVGGTCSTNVCTIVEEVS